MKKDIKPSLADILECIGKIEEYLKNFSILFLIVPFNFLTHFIKALLTLSCEIYSSLGAFLTFSNSFITSSLTFIRLLYKRNYEQYNSHTNQNPKGNFPPINPFHNFKFISSIFKSSLVLGLTILLLMPSVLAQTQSHPLSQLTPIDTNLNMNLSGTAYNITNISWITYSGGIVFAGTRGIPTNDIQDSAITSSKIAAAVALTGNVSIDSPTFFVDSSNDRVGIGTTNPDSTLHVIGGVCAETSDTGCAAVAGYVRGNTGLCMGSDCKTSWSQVGGVSPWDNSSTQIFVTNGYPLYVNASNTLFVNGTSGKVGIGTPNPGAKLEVAGQVKITGGVPGAGKVLTSDAAGLATWATPTGVPSGVIVMWSGLLENIPAGWALCDGTNGTPDLRDKFIYGTSAGETPGATGGANSYTLTTAQLPSHTHAISEDGTHTHQVVRKISTAGGGTGLLTESPVENAFASGLTQGSGSHSHGGATGSAGSGNSIDNRPSFVKLAFIMKL